MSLLPGVHEAKSPAQSYLSPQKKKTFHRSQTDGLLQLKKILYWALYKLTATAVN